MKETKSVKHVLLKLPTEVHAHFKSLSEAKKVTLSALVATWTENAWEKKAAKAAGEPKVEKKHAKVINTVKKAEKK